MGKKDFLYSHFFLVASRPCLYTIYMSDIAKRLAWSYVASSAVAYMVFLTVGSYIYTRAADSTGATLVRDELTPGAHHLSGMVMVPSTCAELIVHTEQVSAELYRLHFKTWETPGVECVSEETPRAFRTLVSAPAMGLRFIATLDDIPYPIVVLPTIR